MVTRWLLGGYWVVTRWLVGGYWVVSGRLPISGFRWLLGGN